MSNLMNAANKIPKDRQINPVRPERLDPDHAAGVLHVTRRYKSADRTIKAGCDLFRVGERGDAIYSLVDGWVALYNLLEDGRKQILQFALPGAILAFIPVRGAMMNYSAQALTDSVVGIIPHENLGRLARDNPEVGMQLAGLISQDRGLAYDHLSSIGRRSARERVAYLLIELFIRSRLRWPGHRSEEMYLPLTQEHIGDATGLTGVHVNRVLRDLRKEGIAEFHYRRLQILNPDKLVDVAGIEPHVALSWINDELSDEVVTDHRKRGDIPPTVHLDAIRRRGLQPAPRSTPPPAKGAFLKGFMRLEHG
ncbi:Crp/Fnr family transcriptional regulator [Roseiarcaceae bacterium H3SJ34-1]|uniref:Crp/Fnr family transcriptional regulator n=1 Tax=Terripilifer ovatus TaxID=3032367 RepID=UPI003AB985AD|nr:Crp/Fnr family transcriptional regulator [Roseiarcaceae bacterium H3SJ34-1]